MTTTEISRLTKKPVEISGVEYYRMTLNDIYECLGWERECSDEGGYLNFETGSRAYVTYYDGTTWDSEYDKGIKPKRHDIEGAIWIIDDWSFGLYGYTEVIEYYDPDLDGVFTEAIFTDELDDYIRDYEDVKILYTVRKSKSEPLEDIEHMIKSRRN